MAHTIEALARCGTIDITDKTANPAPLGIAVARILHNTDGRTILPIGRDLIHMRDEHMEAAA